MYSSIDLVIKVARPVLKNQATTVEVCKEAETGWCDTIQSALSKTVLGRSCSNVCTQVILVCLTKTSTIAKSTKHSNTLIQRLDGTSSLTHSAH